MLDLPDRRVRRREVRLERLRRRPSPRARHDARTDLWLVLMVLMFAIVDFLEDGVLGNARRREA